MQASSINFQQTFEHGKIAYIGGKDSKHVELLRLVSYSFHVKSVPRLARGKEVFVFTNYRYLFVENADLHSLLCNLVSVGLVKRISYFFSCEHGR